MGSARLVSMALNTLVERTGTAVRAALQEVAPAEADAFQAEFRAALARAADSLDLGDVERVLTHWWGILHLRLQPLTEPELDAVRRLRAGEDVGWSSPSEYRAAKGL